ncbi:hypothetical protein MRX96_036121 [Rhipicephalus microplus]
MGPAATNQASTTPVPTPLTPTKMTGHAHEASSFLRGTVAGRATQRHRSRPISPAADALGVELTPGPPALFWPEPIAGPFKDLRARTMGDERDYSARLLWRALAVPPREKGPKRAASVPVWSEATDPHRRPAAGATRRPCAPLAPWRKTKWSVYGWDWL